jgi:DNA-binding GntR family transcriptional regulator
MKLSIETCSLVDAVAEALRDQILSGDIPAQTRLTEKTVAGLAGVARPTAKAALELLVHSGLLRGGPNRTVHVPLMNAASVSDLYASRLLVERKVVVELARRRYVPPSAREALDQFDKAATRGCTASIVKADGVFHATLVAALGSPRLTRMHQVVMGEAQLCMAQVRAHHLLKTEAIAGEHAEIVDAIGGGDSASADRLLTAHLQDSCKRLTAFVPG